MGLIAQISLCVTLAAGGATYYHLSTRPTPKSKPASTTYPTITTSNRTIQTATGRTIGFAQYGSDSSNARTLLFYHGLPGSRIIPVPGLKIICEEKNIRLLVLDRPGIGLTSPATDEESTFDVSLSDTLQVLNEIRLYTGTNVKIGVIGYSMGGPHALKLVQEHSDMVDRLYMIAPSSFYVHPKDYVLSPEWTSVWQTQSHPLAEHMCTANRIAHVLSRWAPRMIIYGWNLASPSLTHEDNYINGMFDATSPDDQASLTREDRAQWALTARETFRQGIGGMMKAVLETFGQMSPSGWGWDIRDVKNGIQSETNKSIETHIYAARTDYLTPFASVIDLADLIGVGRANFKVYEGIGHLALLRDAISDILDQEGPK